jgi:hypothetical protein
MDSAGNPEGYVSQKSQEIVELYDNYVAGGFAPYPVRPFEAIQNSWPV